MFVLVLCVCVCVSAGLSVNSTDRLSAIQFQSIQWCIVHLRMRAGILELNWGQSFLLLRGSCTSAACLAHHTRGKSFGSESWVKLLRVWVDSRCERQAARATSPIASDHSLTLQLVLVRETCSSAVAGAEPGRHLHSYKSSFPLSPSEHSRGKEQLTGEPPSIFRWEKAEFVHSCLLLPLILLTISLLI